MFGVVPSEADNVFSRPRDGGHKGEILQVDPLTLGFSKDIKRRSPSIDQLKNSCL